MLKNNEEYYYKNKVTKGLVARDLPSSQVDCMR